MTDSIINLAGGLIESKIIPIKVTYYLITNDSLNSIKSKSILSDIFMLLSSLMWGSYISVIITLKITFEPSATEMTILQTLSKVFLYGGILFTILAGFFLIWNFVILKGIKKSELKIKENDNG